MDEPTPNSEPDSSELDRSQSAGFAWPPKDAPPARVTKPSPISIRLPNTLIESIETHLLGRTGLAFDLWAQQTGWVRDDTSVYCWRCGGSVGKHETDGDGCAICRIKPLPWSRAIRLGRHKDTLRQEVLALKFSGWRPTGRGLGAHLGLAIREQLDAAHVDPSQAALVPIPMHWRRRVARGVDHTLVLARAASQSSGIPVLPILSTRYRGEQVGLTKTARAENIKDAFFFSRFDQRRLKKTMAQNQRIYILIDDVRTTGATFVAASKTLKTLFLTNEDTNSASEASREIWTACIGVAGETRREVVDLES